MNFLNTNTIKANATHIPITESKSRNEIYIDVVENLHCLFNPSNMVVSDFVDGCIKMKSYLTGENP